MFKVETGTTTEFGDGFEAGFGFEAPPFLEWSHDGRSLFVAQLRPGADAHAHACSGAARNDRAPGGHERLQIGSSGQRGLWSKSPPYHEAVSRARVAVVVFLVATFAGLYFAAQAHWNPVLRAPVPHALLVNLVYYWLWALATPLIIAAARRFRFESGRWTRSLAAHALLSVIVAACQVVAAETILKVPDVRYELSFLGQLGFAFLVNFQSSLPTYWLILFAYLTFDYYVKYRDREVRSAQLTSELSRAQLQALRMQLAPHFLFNTLNSIASLMYTNVDAAERMVVRLSEFLRLTLDRDIGQEVPLEREIDFVRRYLEIEKVRFEERLNVSFDISSDSRDALVPALVLQPLIENAIHHGIAARPDGGSIAVRAARRDGELLIRVADDGVGGDEGERRERIGLANTRARLERLYGSAHSLQLTTLLSGGAVVDMTIPYHTEPVSW